VLSVEQVDRLLKPVRAGRVFKSQGFDNLAAWDVSAHLTRVFGFGNWDKRILSLELISCAIGDDVGEKGKLGWYVTYSCDLALTVRNNAGRVVWVNDDTATGSAQNQPHLGDAHDLARKNAVSYALKRCAKDLGDQFGLSLYAGTQNAVVGMTLVGASGSVLDAVEPDHDVEGEEPSPSPEMVTVADGDYEGAGPHDEPDGNAS
jgi:hypothetical protein